MHQTTLERIEQELKKIKRQLQCGTQFFDTVEEFPAVGVPCAIYVDKSTGAFYVYDTETATYITADAGEDIDFSLTTTGTSGPATLVGTILNIPQYQGVLTNPVTGTGTSGQVAYWNGTTTQTGSNNLFWDAANERLGVGTNAPNRLMQLSGADRRLLSVYNTGNNSSLIMFQNAQTGVADGDGFAIGIDDSENGWLHNYENTNTIFTTNATERLRITSAGNVLVGNTDGTGRLTVRGSGTTSATTALLVQNSTPSALMQVTDDGQTTLSPTANTSALVSSTYNVTGSGTTPLINLSGTWNTTGIINGILINITDTASSSSSSLMNLQINSSSIFRVAKSIGGFAGGPIAPNGYGLGLGAQAIYNCNSSNTVINSAGTAINFSDSESSNSGYSYHFFSQQYVNKIYTSGTGGFVTILRGFAPTSGTGVFNALNIQNTINQTGGANGITRGLYVNPTLTSAADWRSVEFSNNTGWGLYGAGTANNYLGGRLGIGTTTLTNATVRNDLSISGATTSYGYLSLQTILSTVTDNARIFHSEPSLQQTAFTLNALTHYFAVQSVIAGGAVLNNQYGFFAHQTLTGATNNYGFYGNIASGTGRWNLYMNGTADNYLGGSLGIGTTSLTGYNMRMAKAITGATTSYGVSVESTLNSDVTNAANIYFSSVSTQTAAYTLTSLRHFFATGAGIGGSSAITNQFGYSVASSMTTATNNYGFYGDIASGTGRWNIYMNGTAANYLAGNTSIGTTTSSGRLTVQGSGTTSATTALLVQNSTPSELFKVADNGAVRIGNAGSISPIISSFSTATGSIDLNATNLQFISYTQTQAASAGVFQFFSAYSAMSQTSGSNVFFSLNSGFNPTSGTADFSGLRYTGTINQTGGANGITRGLYVNPTLTAAADWRGVEITTSTVNTVVLGKNTGSAAVEVTSTTQGFLPPRMTTAQRNLIASPAAGLVIFNTTTTKLECYDGAAWQAAW